MWRMTRMSGASLPYSKQNAIKCRTIDRKAYEIRVSAAVNSDELRWRTAVCLQAFAGVVRDQAVIAAVKKVDRAAYLANPLIAPQRVFEEKQGDVGHPLRGQILHTDVR